MGVPWGCLFIEFRYSMLQQYRELQLAFYKKKQLIIWQTITQKNHLQIMDEKFTFFWPSPIPFYPFYKVGVEIPQIYTESDKLSFYKAPPGHLIRTKTVQTLTSLTCGSLFHVSSFAIISVSQHELSGGLGMMPTWMHSYLLPFKVQGQ
jgi:hypothetical protein